MKVYVLNLKEDKDRLQSISKALEQLNISWERVEAIRGSLINRKEHPEIFCGTEFVVKYNAFSKAYYRGSLTDGELGCALSHLKVYHQIAMNNEDGAIIMEDDFVPKGATFVGKRKRARTAMLHVANCLLGENLGDDTLIVRLYKDNDEIKSQSITNMDTVLTKTTIAEIQYLVFDIISSEYHNQLYGELLSMCGGTQHKVNRV